MGNATYRVGCASWLDASLLAEGSFYPSPHMTAAERLRWYARFFEGAVGRLLLEGPRVSGLASRAPPRLDPRGGVPQPVLGSAADGRGPEVPSGSRPGVRGRGLPLATAHPRGHGRHGGDALARPERQ